MVSDATHFLKHAAMCLRYLAGDDLLCTFWLNMFFFSPGMHEALGMIGDDCCSTVEAPRSAPCSALRGASRCLISMACKECSVPIPDSSNFLLSIQSIQGLANKNPLEALWSLFDSFLVIFFLVLLLDSTAGHVSWKTKTGKGSRPSGAWHDADPAAIRRNSAVSKSLCVDCKSVRFDYAFDTYESSRMHASRLDEKALPFRQSLQTRTSMPLLCCHTSKALQGWIAGQVMHAIVMIMNNIVYSI